MHAHRDRGLTLIGVFKLAKAVLLVSVGVGLLRLLHRDVAQSIESLVEQLRIDPHNALVHGFVGRLLGLSHRQLAAMGVGTFLYAALFATEGIGLILGQHWAEYLTLGVTISFIPVELFEVIKHASVLKAVITAVNIAIAVYLARKVRSQRKERSQRATPTQG